METMSPKRYGESEANEEHIMRWVKTKVSPHPTPTILPSYTHVLALRHIWQLVMPHLSRAAATLLDKHRNRRSLKTTGQQMSHRKRTEWHT